MSILNVLVTPKRALIAVDTDSLDLDGSRSNFSKLLTIPHARVVLAIRGDRRFLFDMFKAYFLGTRLENFDQVIEAAPSMLASVLTGFREEGAHGKYQLVIAGWSPKRGRVAGWYYLGDIDSDDCDIEELGARIIPWEFPDQAPVPSSPETVQAIAARQVDWLRARGAAGGGNLLLATLEEHRLMIERFPIATASVSV